MAMRPRGGSAAGSRRATRSGVVRSVYEDFKPVSEWQQDDESHILNIYLPGFMKEQIRITMEGRNTIRVRGERLVAGNKWSRFLEDFQVPENGEINSVRAKFQGGILGITVPKEKVSKPQEALPPENRGVDDIRRQPTPQKGQVKAIPEVISQATDVKGGSEPQNLSGDPEKKDGNQKQPIPQKGLDKPFPEVGTSQSTEEKSLEPVKASAEPNNDRDLDDDQRGRSFIPLRSTRNEVSQDTEKKESSEKAQVDPKNTHDRDGDQRGRNSTPMRSTGKVISQNAEKRESNENKEKHVEPEDVTKEKVHKEVKETMGGSELPEAETTKTKKSEKSRATGIPEKTADNKDLYGASKKQNNKKAMKGLTELNEERQLLVNMGVAMLVIVALTAYVTHNFASAKHKN